MFRDDEEIARAGVGVEVVAPEPHLLNAPEHEPAPINAVEEAEMVREPCFCMCAYDSHESGGQCRSHPSCRLYTPISNAMEARAAHGEDGNLS